MKGGARKGGSSTHGVEAVHELGDRVKAMLQSLGLGYHKETYGESAITLGHEISPGTFGVRAAAVCACDDAMNAMIRCICMHVIHVHTCMICMLMSACTYM